jgi:hypothetical protein
MRSLAEVFDEFFVGFRKACWWALVVASGCAAPTRHLTTRALEDPAVLPRGLAAASVGASVSRLDAPRMTNGASDLGFSYGITDKLELDRLALRYAFLDDAPAPAGTPPETPRARLSLVLRAGLDGLGYSSTEHLIAEPALSVRVGKHLGERVRVSASLEWFAFWASNPQPASSAYSLYLWPRGDRLSQLTLSTGVLVQLADHLSVGYGLFFHQMHACVVPTCDEAARGVSTSLGPSLRPWRWLAVSVWGLAGVRWRPDAPPPTQTQVSWLGAGGDVTLTW